MLRRRLLASLLASALFVFTPALAQAQDEEAARALFKDGLALQEKGDLAGALDRYRAAYTKWDNPKILVNIGTAALQLGRHLEAAEAYDRFLDTAPSDDATRAEVEKALTDALAHVGTLAITLTGGPAETDLDGRRLDAAARLDRIRVEPGAHTLRARGPRGAPAERTLNVEAGETVAVALDVSAPPPLRHEATPASRPAPRAVEPAPPEESEKEAAGTSGSALPWIIGGVGVAALATSGVLFVLRGNATGDLDRDCLGDVCPDASQGAIDRANRLGTFGLVAVGAGAVGVGIGVALLLGEGEALSPAAGLRLDLAADGRGARASVRASF